MEDTDIVSLYLSRDQSALSATDSRYGSKLKRISLGITGDRRDAEECVNDVYLTAWNTIPPQIPERLFSYLCEITRRVSLSRYRYNTAEKRGEKTLCIDELSEVIEDTKDNTDGLSDILNEFLSDLDRRSRYIFMRRYYYADDIPTIAKQTGLGKNAISARLMRLRKKLAEKLQKEGYKYEN